MQVIECEQYSPEWWEAHQGIPTASEASRIVTDKKWQYASAAKLYICQLIADSYNPNYGLQDDYVTAAMRMGRIIEPEARRWLEFSHDCHIQQVGFCVSDCGSFGCSPDGLMGDDGGCEIKSPEKHTHVSWLLAGGVPEKHLAQIHWSLVVTGRRWWEFLSYCPPLPPLRERVERDEKTEQLAGYMQRFADEYAAAKAKIAAMQQPTPTKVEDFGELGTVETTPGEEIPF